MEESEAIVFLKRNIGGLRVLAFDSAKTLGRRMSVDSDSWMYGLAGPFVIDQQKIESSKAWRRLAGKTQVFSLQFNPHVRTRQSHTQEVVSNAAFIAQILGLNVDLCVSLAKAHDVGHLPFGHAGERFMEKITGRPFDHATYGAVLLQEVERGGGANFSFEVLEGVTYHSGKIITADKPEEYRVVYWADKIAYVCHDINDAARKGMPVSSLTGLIDFGATQRERTRKCLVALMVESLQAGKVSFECSTQAQIFKTAKAWLFTNVYYQIDDAPCFNMLDAVYSFLAKESENKESVFFGINPVISLSLMTDWECWRFYQALISNSPSPAAELGVAEIAPTIREKKINWEEPDFSWIERR